MTKIQPLRFYHAHPAFIQSLVEQKMVDPSTIETSAFLLTYWGITTCTGFVQILHHRREQPPSLSYTYNFLSAWFRCLTYIGSNPDIETSLNVVFPNLLVAVIKLVNGEPLCSCMSRRCHL